MRMIHKIGGEMKSIFSATIILILSVIFWGACGSTGEIVEEAPATEEPRQATIVPEITSEEPKETIVPTKARELIYANASDQKMKIELDNQGKYEIKLSIQTDQNEVIQTSTIKVGKKKNFTLQPNTQIWGWLTETRELNVKLLDTIGVGGGNSFLSVKAYPVIFKNLAVNNIKLDIQAQGDTDPEDFYYCVPELKVKSDANQSGFIYWEGAQDLSLSISENLLPGGDAGITCSSYRTDKSVGINVSVLDWRFTNIGTCPFQISTSDVKKRSIRSDIVDCESRALVYTHKGKAKNILFFFSDDADKTDIEGHSWVEVNNGAGYQEVFSLSVGYEQDLFWSKGYAIGIFVTMMDGGTIEIYCCGSAGTCDYEIFEGKKKAATAPSIAAEYDQKEQMIRITIISLPGKAVALFASTFGKGSTSFDNFELDLDSPTMIFADVLHKPQVVIEYPINPDSQINTYYFQAVSASDQALTRDVEVSNDDCSVDIK